MSVITRREFEELRRDVARMRQELAQRPLFGGGGGGTSSVYSLIIDVGNTLNDGVTTGIKFASPVSTVPSLYDPNVTSSFVDGIGRATLYIDGVPQSGYVLVLHDGTGGTISDALFTGDLCLTSPVTTSVPLAGDPTQSVTCYRALTP